MKKILLIALISAGLSANSLNIKTEGKCSSVDVNKCAACHGKHFEKHAMGKSKIVKDMDSTMIYNELKEYKNGKLNQYGMGVLMKMQVKNYSDTELHMISSIIKDEK